MKQAGVILDQHLYHDAFSIYAALQLEAVDRQSRKVTSRRDAR